MDATHNCGARRPGRTSTSPASPRPPTQRSPGSPRPCPATVVLARFDPDSEILPRHRPARGPDPGPRARRDAARRGPRACWLDQELLSSAGIKSSLVFPLELHDGNVVGLVCAFAPDAGAYMEDHRGPRHPRVANPRLRVGGVSAPRPSCATSARRPGTAARPTPRPASSTATPSSRCSTASGASRSAAPCSPTSSPAASCVEGTAQRDRLAGRDLGDSRTRPRCLAGVARTTDHVGRVGASTLAAVLVGCHGAEGAEAFVARLPPRGRARDPGPPVLRSRSRAPTATSSSSTPRPRHSPAPRTPPAPRRRQQRRRARSRTRRHSRAGA